MCLESNYTGLIQGVNGVCMYVHISINTLSCLSWLPSKVVLHALIHYVVLPNLHLSFSCIIFSIYNKYLQSEYCIHWMSFAWTWSEGPVSDSEFYNRKKMWYFISSLVHSVLQLVPKTDTKKACVNRPSKSHDLKLTKTANTLSLS